MDLGFITKTYLAKYQLNTSLENNAENTFLPHG